MWTGHHPVQSREDVVVIIEAAVGEDVDFASCEDRDVVARFVRRVDRLDVFEKSFNLARMGENWGVLVEKAMGLDQRAGIW